MKRATNPMRRSWLDDSDGGWIAHRLLLLQSPSWRRRPKPLARILERLEIEHLKHRGSENGNLSVSYRQFADEAGVSKRAISGSLRLGQALGLLEIIQSGEWAGDVRAPNVYRLTYVPAKGKRAPTDEWLRMTTDDVDLALAVSMQPDDEIPQLRKESA